MEKKTLHQVANYIFALSFLQVAYVAGSLWIVPKAKELLAEDTQLIKSTLYVPKFIDYEKYYDKNHKYEFVIKSSELKGLKKPDMLIDTYSRPYGSLSYSAHVLTGAYVMDLVLEDNFKHMLDGEKIKNLKNLENMDGIEEYKTVASSTRLFLIKVKDDLKPEEIAMKVMNLIFDDKEKFNENIFFSQLPYEKSKAQYFSVAITMKDRKVLVDKDGSQVPEKKPTLTISVLPKKLELPPEEIKKQEENKVEDKK